MPALVPDEFDYLGPDVRDLIHAYEGLQRLQRAMAEATAAFRLLAVTLERREPDLTSPDG